MPDQTIAAIATPPGLGGIGIVRLSGADALHVAARIFFPRSGADIALVRGYTVHYGQVRQDDLCIDEALCLCFRAPHSYTGENAAEIQCHGAAVVLRRCLRAALAAGARLAEPGEFTKRAFLNGRIDFTQAEAVLRLIHAKTDAAAAAAISNLQGALRLRIEDIQSRLIHAAAAIAAGVDYPEESLAYPAKSEVAAFIYAAQTQLEDILHRANHDIALFEGIPAAIVGKPNVGKSTFLNTLLGFDRAIVSEIPGTTRDTLRESVTFAGILLHLTDTAGIHATADPIEQTGVARANDALRTARLIFVLLDASRPLTTEDRDILDLAPPERTIYLRSKCDLPSAWEESDVLRPLLSVSCAKKTGFSELERTVRQLLTVEDEQPGLFCNERQIVCARDAAAALERAAQTLARSGPLDLLSQDLEDAAQSLYTLTGERANTAIVDDVFARFCVGK
jgi:tRNA modification GTPase